MIRKEKGLEFPDWDSAEKWEEMTDKRLAKRVAEKAGFKSAKCASCKNLIYYMAKGENEDNDNLIKFNCTHWDKTRQYGTKTSIAGSVSREGIFTSGCISGYSPWVEADTGETGTGWLDVTAEMEAANSKHLKQIREEAEVHKFSDERKAFQSILDKGWPKSAAETPGINPKIISMNDIAAARDMVSL